MNFSDHVCGALRHKADEISRTPPQSMARATRLRKIADTIESTEDIQDRLALADPWMANSSFDLLDDALRLLRLAVEANLADVTAAVVMWSLHIEGMAMDANKAEHGWGDPV